MGFFKQVKDMKQMVNAAPEMISQAQRIGAQAQAMAAAQAGAAQTMRVNALAGEPAADAPRGPDFEPVSGVSLELYAEISRELAASGGGVAEAGQVAGSKGVRAENWQAALEGWNLRMRSNPAVAKQFNRVYTEA